MNRVITGVMLCAVLIVAFGQNAVTPATQSQKTGCQMFINCQAVTIPSGSNGQTFASLPAAQYIANGESVSTSDNGSAIRTGAYWTVIGAKLTVYTVSTLPTCGASTLGLMAAVSDATSPTYNGALTGGGAVSIPVYCGGTSWTAH